MKNLQILDNICPTMRRLNNSFLDARHFILYYHATFANFFFAVHNFLHMPYELRLIDKESHEIFWTVANSRAFLLHYNLYIIIWLSLLVLFVRIPFTAKPAGLDPPNFRRQTPNWMWNLDCQKKFQKNFTKFF
jgi:hypothetical protein